MRLRTFEDLFISDNDDVIYAQSLRRRNPYQDSYTVTRPRYTVVSVPPANIGETPHEMPITRNQHISKTPR